MKIKRYTFVNVADADGLDQVDDVVYVDRVQMIAFFRCPCGCNAQIILNLIPGASPCWSVSGNTISPSINRAVGCKSHFSIKNAIVE